MQFKNLNVRPMRESDVAAFERLRRSYWEADLEIPKGWYASGVETAVVEQDGLLVVSLTSTQAVVFDPLIKNPAFSGPTLVASILLAERTLAYEVQKRGAVDAYIAVPNQLTEYHAIVQKAGYVPTVENCTVYKRPLNPDTNPLLNAEREALLAQNRPESESTTADTPTPEAV